MQFRLNHHKPRKGQASSKRSRARQGARKQVSGDLGHMEMMVQKPKRVLHSKNPFKIKQPKIRLERRTKKEPLDGLIILNLCKCKKPEEVLRLDLSGRGYSSIYQTDLKQFTNVLEIDLSDNYLNLQDIEVLVNLNKVVAHNNLISSIQVRENSFPCLEMLDLSFNNIHPETLVSLANLERLK